MGVIDRFKAAVVRRFSLTEPETWSGGGRATDAGEIVNESSILGLSAVWACTNLLAGTIATLPAIVYQRTNAESQVQRDHPLSRLLRDSPNYDQTAVDFWEFMAASLELWGNAYAAVERNRGVVVSLMPIRPDVMSVKRLKNGSIEYSWTDEGKGYTKTDTEVFHVRGFGGSPLGGMSTMHFGRQAFGLAKAIDKAAATTFKNGVRPSGVLTLEGFLPTEKRDAAEQAIADKFVGSMNAGRPMILEGGTKWEQLSINPEDAQMLESRKFSIEEVCRFFGVPPHMIGHTENSTSWGTGLEQQTLGFQKFTLRRRLKRIEQAVNKQLLTAAERSRGLYVEFNLEGLLRADSASRATFYAAGLKDGWMTINEVRGHENLAPVPGGDTPRIQMQNVPITTADEQARIANDISQ
jgi:HK97 family phage portal protein